MIGNPIIKNSLVYGITCLFVISCLSSGASRFDEIVDQHQDNFYTSQGFTVNVNEYGKEHVVAQSFKPSMTPLTKVDLVILTSVFATLPVIVSIRDSLEGNDLTSITTPPDQIPQDNASWHTFDFPDITVVPENTYYIIIRSNETIYGYFIGFFNSIVDNYPRGAAWSYYDGNWTLWEEGSNYFFDCAFKTYSNIQPPTPPTISGSHYGKINTNYTFSLGDITDPDGDQLYGYWSWGDGTGGWFGPYDSGQTGSASHTWNEPGNYSIKVKIKDIYGAESDWSAPFYIEIVRLKTKLFLGIFESMNQTEDLIILHARLFIVFPSYPIFNIGGIVVLSKEYYGYLGRIVAFGVGGSAVF